MAPQSMQTELPRDFIHPILIQDTQYMYIMHSYNPKQFEKLIFNLCTLLS